jgi:hypothetical protein
MTWLSQIKSKGSTAGMQVQCDIAPTQLLTCIVHDGSTRTLEEDLENMSSHKDRTRSIHKVYLYSYVNTEMQNHGPHENS